MATGRFPRGTEHERASTARFHRQREGEQSVPLGFRAVTPISAARAVIQTEKYDYAWTMQAEEGILQRLVKDGKGSGGHHCRRQHRAHQLNSTDPWTEVDGERSSVKVQASGAERPGPCDRRWTCWSIDSPSKTTSMGAPA